MKKRDNTIWVCLIAICVWLDVLVAEAEGRNLLQDDHFVSGTRVLLRAQPDSASEVIDVLPFQTRVIPLPNMSNNGFVLIQIVGTDRTGFVSKDYISKNGTFSTEPPSRLNNICGCSYLTQEFANGDERWTLFKKERKEGAAGCFHNGAKRDPFCLSLRTSLKAGRDFSDTLEKSLARAYSINHRLALWSMALAPESPYRKKSSLEILNASPLFAPMESTRSQRLSEDDLRLAADLPFIADFFGSTELQKKKESSDEHWILRIGWSDGQWMFRGYDIAPRSEFGIGSSKLFSRGSAQLSKDRDVVELTAVENVVVFNPCERRFQKVGLTDVHYRASSGRLDFTFKTKANEQIMTQCWQRQKEVAVDRVRTQRIEGADLEGGVDHSLAHFAYVDEFFVVMDVSKSQALSTMLLDSNVYQKRFKNVDGGSFRTRRPSSNYEMRWVRKDKAVAFLRSLTDTDCGLRNIKVLQFLEEGVWHRVISELRDTTDSCEGS